MEGKCKINEGSDRWPRATARSDTRSPWLGDHRPVLRVAIAYSNKVFNPGRSSLPISAKIAMTTIGVALLSVIDVTGKAVVSENHADRPARSAACHRHLGLAAGA